MKKVCNSFEEMEKFIEPLISEDKWFIDIRRVKDTEQYTVEWVEHKEYVSHDGKVYRDEVWITKDNVPYFVQDMSPEHARNALRMMLRNERHRNEMLSQIHQALEGAGDLVLDGLEDEVDSLFPESTRPDSKPTLH